MPRRLRRYPLVVLTAALGFGAFPTIGQAQEASLPEHAPTPQPGVITAASRFATGDVAVTAVPSEPLAPTTRAIETGTPRPAALMPLYVSFAALQALDAHSTMRALGGGASEGNPLLKEVANRPVALMAVKAGVAASTIFLTEKLRVKNRVGAVVLMAALNSAYAMVVVHNYRNVP